MTQKTVPAFEVIGFSIMNMSIQFCEMLCFLQLNTFKGLEQISRGWGCGGHCTSLVIFLWFETTQNKVLGEVTPKKSITLTVGQRMVVCFGMLAPSMYGTGGRAVSAQCAGQGSGVTSECPQR